MTGVSSKTTLAMLNFLGMLIVEKTNSTLSEADPSSRVRRRIDKTVESVSGSSLVLKSDAEYSVGMFLANAFFCTRDRNISLHSKLSQFL